MGRLGPDQPLPLSNEFSNADDYVKSLLEFGTGSQLFQTLCGGVHILDFFTRTPDLYESILPASWREWFEHHEIEDVLDFFMRADVEELRNRDSDWNRDGKSRDEEASEIKEQVTSGEKTWRGHPLPPAGLVEYITTIRSYCLDRGFTPLPPYQVSKQLSQDSGSRPRPSQQAIYAGMNVKKRHEVSHFSHFVADLAARVSNAKPSSEDSPRGITHIVDFGSGQNYLGRVLASEPYCKHIIAVESRPHVVLGAKRMDVRAKLAQKGMVWRDKRKFKEASGQNARKGPNISEKSSKSSACEECVEAEDTTAGSDLNGTETARAKLEVSENGQGSVQYVEHRIQDGDLSAVIEKIVEHHPGTDAPNPSYPYSQDSNDSLSGPPLPSSDPAIMVISLHSCGNLLHHGLRTISLNPAVQVVAMVGCCYNLMTERLGPRTYKIPSLRSNHPRLVETSSARDPHGFPMSKRFMEHKHNILRPPNYKSKDEKLEIDHVVSESEEGRSGVHDEDEWEIGIRLNITARMMAVQAPKNWSPAESSAFFTRHFYRAVLQRIFVDKGVLAAPPELMDNQGRGNDEGKDPSQSSPGTDTVSQVPIIIGHLSKPQYATFRSYIRGAVQKLLSPSSTSSPVTLARIRSHVATLTDFEIAEYESRYTPHKKDLSIIWSLMAFSSQVVEAMIVVDRWLWLMEQESVGEAWVQTGFEYTESPRNLVVVGVRK